MRPHPPLAEHLRTTVTRSPLIPVLVGFLAVTSAVLTSTAQPSTASVQLSPSATSAALGDRGMSLSRSASRGLPTSEPLAQQRPLQEFRRHGLSVAQHRWATRLRAERRWGLPVAAGTYTLTARFGASGYWSRLHTGLDFAAPEGTPILAVAHGRIVSTGYEGSYGNLTKERLRNGTVLYYGHQSAFAVRPGQRVHRGELIGLIGSTGNVTGPHVHLEVRRHGTPVDPYPVLLAHRLHP